MHVERISFSFRTLYSRSRPSASGINPSPSRGLLRRGRLACRDGGRLYGGDRVGITRVIEGPAESSSKNGL